MTNICSLKKWVLPAIAAIVFVGNMSSQVLDPSLAFNGTWQREDGQDTITLSIKGDIAIMTNSNGASGRAVFNGDTIEYTGKIQTDEGLVKSVGTFKLSPDGSSLIKHREIYYASGTKEETSTYTRVASPSPTFTPTPTPTPTPKPTPKPIPFVGLWHPADDSSTVTITIAGRTATLKYSDGSRDSGSVGGNKIETEPATQSGGIKRIDIFEMSSNGRTLIRRRTLQSPKGEIGHETLTYNRAE